jgi:hypothetical protein
MTWKAIALGSTCQTPHPTPTQICPECGAAMKEADRLMQDGFLYIWYRCSRSYCSGSWLERYTAHRVSELHETKTWNPQGAPKAS